MLAVREVRAGEIFKCFIRFSGIGASIAQRTMLSSIEPNGSHLWFPGDVRTIQAIKKGW
jgi:hypothetical protein